MLFRSVQALTSGTGTFVAQSVSQAAVTAAAPSTLKEAIDAVAASIDGSSHGIVSAFQYGGATYAFIDNSSGATATATDVVIKLTGTLSLTAQDFVL